MHFSRLGVEREVFETKHGLVAIGEAASAQECAQSREQFSEVEGFDQVVVRAHVETLDAVVHGVSGGEHEDWRGVTGAADSTTDLESVDVG